MIATKVVPWHGSDRPGGSLILPTCELETSLRDPCPEPQRLLTAAGRNQSRTRQAAMVKFACAETSGECSARKREAVQKFGSFPGHQRGSAGSSSRMQPNNRLVLARNDSSSWIASPVERGADHRGIAQDDLSWFGRCPSAHDRTRCWGRMGRSRPRRRVWATPLFSRVLLWTRELNLLRCRP